MGNVIASKTHLAVKEHPAAWLYGAHYAQENLFAFGQFEFD